MTATDWISLIAIIIICLPCICLCLAPEILATVVPAMGIGLISCCSSVFIGLIGCCSSGPIALVSCCCCVIACLAAAVMLFAPLHGVWSIYLCLLSALACCCLSCYECVSNARGDRLGGRRIVRSERSAFVRPSKSSAGELEFSSEPKGEDSSSSSAPEPQKANANPKPSFYAKEKKGDAVVKDS